MPEWRARRLIACVLGIMVLVGTPSCTRQRPQEAASGVGAPLPAPSPVVDITMREFRFDYPDPVPAGRVVFRIRNAGQRPHRLALLPLEENFPPIDHQVKGTERRAVSPFASIYDRRPGGYGTFAVDLVAGTRYAIVCFTVNSDGESHAVKGMTSEFRAGGGPVPQANPRRT